MLLPRAHPAPRPWPPGAPGGSCPGRSSPHEVVSEVLAPDIVRRLPHQRARHGRAGPQAARSALAAGPRSPMTPAERSERRQHPLAGGLTTARPRLTAAAPRGSRPGGGAGTGAAETIGSHAPHTLSPPLGARGGACAGKRRRPAAIGRRLLGTCAASGPGGGTSGRASPQGHCGRNLVETCFSPRSLRAAARGQQVLDAEVDAGRSAARQPADCAQHRFRKPPAGANCVHNVVHLCYSKYGVGSTSDG